MKMRSLGNVRSIFLPLADLLEFEDCCSLEEICMSDR